MGPPRQQELQSSSYRCGTQASKETGFSILLQPYYQQDQKQNQKFLGFFSQSNSEPSTMISKHSKKFNKPSSLSNLEGIRFLTKIQDLPKLKTKYPIPNCISQALVVASPGENETRGLSFDNTLYQEISEFSLAVPYVGWIIKSKQDFSHSHVSTSSVITEIEVELVLFELRKFIITIY